MFVVVLQCFAELREDYYSLNTAIHITNTTTILTMIAKKTLNEGMVVFL
mgnify:CR=1 FL=1